VASLVSSTAAAGSTAVLNFAVQRVGSILLEQCDLTDDACSSFTMTLMLKLPPQFWPRSLPLVLGELKIVLDSWI
jgi:hypothetical protein